MPVDSQLGLKLEDAVDSVSSDVDPYAEAAQALEQAQRVLSAARATPRPPTMLVSVAERQFDALRAEITTLKAASERDLAAIESLRRVVENISIARDLAQSATQQKSREIDALTATHERERTEFCAQREVLCGQLEGLQSANAKEREALKKDRELLTTDRALLAAETQTAHNAIQGERQAIAQQLHRMLQMIQPNSFAPSTEPASLLPPSPIPSPTLPTAHPGEFPILSRRRPECDTTSAYPSPKRPRTESPPRVVHRLTATNMNTGALSSPTPPNSTPSCLRGPYSYSAPQRGRSGASPRGGPSRRGYPISPGSWASPHTPPAAPSKDPRRR